MTPAENRKELFLRACRSEPVERVPVWIMRQAGRYLPEYQAVRARTTRFLQICKTPEVAAEVSLQPFRIIGVDAIIVFSDILIVAEAMGLPLDVPDSGPVLSNPVRDVAAVRRLRDFDPSARNALCRRCHSRDLRGSWARRAGDRLRRRALDAGVLHDRGPNARRHFAREARCCASEPQLVRELLERIARATAQYLKMQIAAGAAVVQLFDTWAGELTRANMTRSSCPRRKWCTICSATRKCRKFSSPKVPRTCWKACRPPART